MAPEGLFSLAIGLVPPWLVDQVTFTVKEKRLDLYIDFPKSSRFACSVCGEECPVHDTRDHTRRHMDFFPHEAYLHSRVPLVPGAWGASDTCSLGTGRLAFQWQPPSEAERKAAGITQRPAPQNGAGLPVSADFSGHLHAQESPLGRYPAEGLDGKRQGQRITVHGQGRLHHHEPLGRRAPLVREPDHQRDSGRLQQPHPIRQGQSPRLSHPQELHQHGLPHPR